MVIKEKEKMDVVIEILNSVQTEKCLVDIARAINSNFTIVGPYLKFLLEKELIKMNINEKYEITVLGKIWLRAFTKAQEILK